MWALIWISRSWLQPSAGREIFGRHPGAPAIRRDLAVETDLATEAGCLLAIIKEEGGELLEAVDCFDVYSGPNLGADRKSGLCPLLPAPGADSERPGSQALLDKIIARLEQAGVLARLAELYDFPLWCRMM